MKLRNKILVCFLLLISLAFAITTYSSYNVVSNLMENEVHELAAISVSQISKNIDLYLDELYRLTNMSLADESFRRAIRASTGSSQQMSDSTNEIFQFLFNIHLYRSDLHSTVLYTPSGKVYTQGYIKYIEEKTTAALEPWCQEMMTDSTAHFRVVGQRTAELPCPHRENGAAFVSNGNGFLGFRKQPHDRPVSSECRGVVTVSCGFRQGDRGCLQHYCKPGLQVRDIMANQQRHSADLLTVHRRKGQGIRRHIPAGSPSVGNHSFHLYGGLLQSMEPCRRSTAESQMGLKQRQERQKTGDRRQPGAVTVTEAQSYSDEYRRTREKEDTQDPFACSG